jgi:hypothetical protein
MKATIPIRWEEESFNVGIVRSAIHPVPTDRLLIIPVPPHRERRGKSLRRPAAALQVAAALPVPFPAA